MERRSKGGLEEAWYARTVVWMRGLEFDPAGKTEMKGMRWRRESRRGVPMVGRGSETVQSGEAKREETTNGRVKRGERICGRVGFAGSLLLIFLVRLAASSFRSWSSPFSPSTAPSFALPFPLPLLVVVSVPRIRLSPTPRPSSCALLLPLCPLAR